MDNLIISGNVRLEYLNDGEYLYYSDYGWFVSGEPTEQLASIIEESDRISKDKWITVKPNDSFISIDDTPLFDVTIPTHWNVSGDYNDSNGIGFDNELNLEVVESAEDEYDSYISKDTYLDQSKYKYDVPNERVSSYLPKFVGGYGYINGDKIYAYPNKVTKIIKTTSTNTIYSIDISDIDHTHPVFIAKSTDDYDTMKTTLRNYVDVSDSILYIESRFANNDDPQTINNTIAPYTPFAIVSSRESDLGTDNNISHNEHVVLENTDTTTPKSHTYINMRYGFINVETPQDGVVILTYNKKGYEHVVPHNVDVSPITWDAETRIATIVSGTSVPYYSSIYTPYTRINNTDATVPVVVNIRDANGIPVSGVTITATDTYDVTDENGTELIHTIGSYISGDIELVSISDVPESKTVVVNDNRAVGYTHASGANIYIEPNPEITSSTVTDTYGSAYLEISTTSYYEPVSTLAFAYDIESPDIGISGDVTLNIEIENRDIIASGIIDKTGGYVDSNYIPYIKQKAILNTFNNQNTVVDGWLYGAHAKLYSKLDWLNDNETFTVVKSIPSGEQSVIQTNTISGEYVLVYDEVNQTCL